MLQTALGTGILLTLLNKLIHHLVLKLKVQSMGDSSKQKQFLGEVRSEKLEVKS